MEKTFAGTKDLQALAVLLDGGQLEVTQAVVVDGRTDLTLEFTRAMLEQPQTVRRGLVHRLRTPWTRCRLTLRGIQQLAVTHLADTPPLQAPLVSCEEAHGRCRVIVQAPDGLRLQIEAKTLDGIFADIGEPILEP